MPDNSLSRFVTAHKLTDAQMGAICGVPAYVVAEWRELPELGQTTRLILLGAAIVLAEHERRKAEPNADTQAAMADARDGKVSTFETTEALMDDLHKDD